MNGTFFYIGLGLGLATACGLRPYLPALLSRAVARSRGARGAHGVPRRGVARARRAGCARASPRLRGARAAGVAAGARARACGGEVRRAAHHAPLMAAAARKQPKLVLCVID